jgi:hypothetical protein
MIPMLNFLAGQALVAAIYRRAIAPKWCFAIQGFGKRGRDSFQNPEVVPAEQIGMGQSAPFK